jgi:hypothetical protein
MFLFESLFPQWSTNPNNCSQILDLPIKVRRQLIENQGSTDSIASMDYLLGKMDKMTSLLQERLLSTLN